MILLNEESSLGRIILGTGLLALLTAILNCGQPDPEEACGFVQNADSQRVSWNGKTPIPIYVDGGLPDIYLAPIKAAMATWKNGARGKDLFVLKGSLGSGKPTVDGASTVYWLPLWTDGPRNQQATTYLKWGGTQILEADIQVNAQTFTYSVSDERESGAVDFQSLVLHELGHVLGLAHNNNDGSVMAEVLAPGQLRRNLSPKDIENLTCEY